MHKLRIIRQSDGTRDYYLFARVRGQYAQAHVTGVARADRKEEKSRLIEQVFSALAAVPPG